MTVDALASTLSDWAAVALCLGLLAFGLWWLWLALFTVWDAAAAWVDERSQSRTRSLIGQAIYDYEVAHGTRSWAALELAIRVLHPSTVTVTGTTTMRLVNGGTATNYPCGEEGNHGGIAPTEPQPVGARVPDRVGPRACLLASTGHRHAH